MSNRPEHCACGEVAEHCSQWDQGVPGHGYTTEVAIHVSTVGEEDQEWDTFRFEVSLDQAHKLREAINAAIEAIHASHSRGELGSEKPRTPQPVSL